jgi:hypothetical protein
VLQTVPGVIVDRVNVGGAESGQQSAYQAKGASGGENTWNMDGIAITDMVALGSTPTYYDFDMFQDMQVSTGGADVTSPTPGVQLNMVLKSGSNTPRGSSRIYFENESMQSNNLSDELAATIGGDSGKGNRMDQYYDTGFELGGPIVKDRLWAWGAYGRTHVDLITLGGTHDRTELKDSSFKANGQITNGIRANYTPEQLLGKLIVIVANLAPRVIRGEESRGMLLAASDVPKDATQPGTTRSVVVLTPMTEIAPGSIVS